MTSARMKPCSKSVWMTPGRLRRRRALRDRPRAHFLLARREIRVQAEQIVSGADQAVEPRLGHAHVGEEHLLVLGVEVGDLRLHRRADRDDGGFLGLRTLSELVEHRIAFEAVLGDVRHVERRLHRQQEIRLQQRALLVVEIDGARGLRLVQRGADLGKHGVEALRLLVAAGTRELLDLADLLVDGREIGQRQLGVDRLDVGERVDPAADVDDVRVLEAADDVRDRVRLADVGEELVAESLALRRSGDQARRCRRTRPSPGSPSAASTIAASAASRGSGTSTIPTFGSIVQNG